MMQWFNIKEKIVYWSNGLLVPSNIPVFLYSLLKQLCFSLFKILCLKPHIFQHLFHFSKQSPLLESPHLPFHNPLNHTPFYGDIQKNPGNQIWILRGLISLGDVLIKKIYRRFCWFTCSVIVNATVTQYKNSVSLLHNHQ